MYVCVYIYIYIHIRGVLREAEPQDPTGVHAAAEGVDHGLATRQAISLLILITMSKYNQ